MKPKLTRLRVLLFKAGYTQRDFAHKIGISESYFSLFSSGRLVPNPHHMKKIAKALKTTPKMIWPELFD